jgi:hypothetical protein
LNDPEELNSTVALNEIGLYIIHTKTLCNLPSNQGTARKYHTWLIAIP